jgi:saccharopine dehydrogenase-like NADP-dependent oxidoreductase
MYKVLIIGGYGKVGTESAKLLSNYSEIALFIGGRDIEKAKKTAIEYNASPIYIDCDDIHSVEEAIKDKDIVINCFIDIERVNTNVAKTCIKYGKAYLDPAGVPNEHLYSIVALDREAKNGKSLILTGLGVNPGIIGILLQAHAYWFDEVSESNVYFTLGSNFEDISVLSLRGVGKMIGIPPKVYYQNEWVKPMVSDTKIRVELPFHKTIYFGPAMITPDIEHLPNLNKFKEIRIWSGVERLFQSLVFILGIKWGYTETDKKAEKFLRLLKYLGKNKKYHPELNLTLISNGILN